MIQAQTFEKERGNENSHPLSECYEWAKSHCIQSEAQRNKKPEDQLVTPMVVICEQYGAAARQDLVRRRFIASTLPAFVAFYKTPKTDEMRHCDEVIGLGPCKAYCDLELELTYENVVNKKWAGSLTEFMEMHNCKSSQEMFAKLDASAAALIAEIVRYHDEVHGVKTVPFVTSANKETKWSKHVTFDDTLWRGTPHIGAYIKRLKQTIGARDKLVLLYLDTAVYTRFRCMRIYRSSKLKEPRRSLVRAGESITTPIDDKALFQSMITLIKLPAAPVRDEVEEIRPAHPHEDMYVTTAFLDRYPEMIAQLGLKPIEQADAAISQLFSLRSSGANGGNMVEYSTAEDCDTSPVDKAFKTAIRMHFLHYDPYLFKWNEREALVHIECKSRKCVIAGATHESNHVFLEVDVLRCKWRQGCYTEKCQQRTAIWHDLPADIESLCTQFAPRWVYRSQFTTLAQLQKK